MLRVVIADDEEHICKLILALADWKRLQMEVVATACNGLEALAFVETFSPDILITDIRMPGCGGLELISRAKEIAPALEVIIISGYAQFDYAQTAIQFGVGEYLLKPVNQEALNSTLEKMAERCQNRKKSATDMELLRQSTLSGQERLRANLLPDLAAGRFAALDAAALRQTYHFHASADTYQLFLLKLDYDLDQFQEPSLAIVRSKAEDIFRSSLPEKCQDFLLMADGSDFYGLVHYAAAQRDALRGLLRECLNQLIAQQSLLGPVVFSLALGQPVAEPASLPQSFQSLRHIVAERLLEGTGRFLERVAAPVMGENSPLPRYVGAATHAIEMFSLEEGQSALDGLKEAALAISGISGMELLELVKGAGLFFMTRLGVEGREQMAGDFDSRLWHSASAGELFDCLSRLQANLLAAALERQKSQTGQPIRLAKQYIQKHYMNPITLEEVSEATGFSVNYFSTLFKKETGEGFAKYLTRVRMEEARNLLRETRLPVSEICKQVGYVDLKHFTHTFKTATGLTPGEFRKLYG